MSSSQTAGTPTRFVRENYFPSSWNTGTEQFCALYPNRYGYIYKPLPGGNWLSADEKWQLSDSLILKSIACAHQKYFIGTRAGRASRFAVLDIDTGSKYHSVEQFHRIRAVLAKAGLRNLVPYRSSSSGGWHLYIFFDKAISSRDLNKQLTVLLQLNRIQVQRGQLEVFPNPGQANTLGFGLRLPMQPGWAWLNPETMELETEREELTALEALDLFIFDLQNCCNSEHDFHRLKRYVEDGLAENSHIAAKQPTTKPLRRDNVVPLRRQTPPADPGATSLVLKAFATLPPGILADVWIKGRNYFQQGLSGPGQRAEAICSLSHYLFYGDPENGLQAMGYGHEQERQYLLEQYLETKHNGHSNEINEGRADALAQIKRATNWRPADKQEREIRAYSKEVPASWPLENERRKQAARMRIQQAVDELTSAGAQVTASAVQQIARCSWKTLYKHADLWRGPQAADNLAPSQYEQIAADFFESSTHEYNDVILGNYSPSSVLTDPTGNSLSSLDESGVCLVSGNRTESISTSILIAELSDPLVPLFNRLPGGRGRKKPIFCLALEFLNIFWFLPLFCFCYLYDPVLRPWSSNYLARRRRSRSAALE